MISLKLVYLCISIQKAHFLMVSTTSLLQGLKYMIITLDNKDHYHQTRNARTFSDHSIRTFGPILWNSLDNNVRKSKSIKHFKNEYKTKLMCLYN